MDARNTFETGATFAHMRLEYLAALLTCVVLAVRNIGEIRWPAFVAAFAVIDLIGYLPGAVAYRRSATGRIPRVYYVLYNVMHSLLTAGALCAVWALVAGPEWAMLAMPIHLFGDRSLFGNSLKPFGVSFEPVTHPAFAAFRRAYEARGGAQIGGGARAARP